ncbi:Sbal_3080 family lipoprotein [Desulfovibrio litoralis]|uniref:Lipoprotein n=1 Tax=Desulfovibrio litoralis DSM 11393 TaxID=1121455 RepID=A0A1M7T6K6_9BACT|nr:Sbal_3080 family lipoprotein [Desulfovibrio litoralis]SHN66363.1 hypothetical protein SAMN02745728_01626 [Desulfovibrio litoralis DSM 11393]
MSKAFKLSFLVCLLFLTACSIKQTVEPITVQTDKTICIVEDPDVKEGFLQTYQQVLRERGYFFKVVHQGDSLQNCAITSTYTGLWRWDLALYLAYARIEVLQDGRRIGLAEYDSLSAGVNMGKFVRGETKIRELVEKLFPPLHTLQTTANPEPSTINKAELVVGGYSAERNLVADDQRVFDQVLQSAAAVEYTPLKVSTQVVAGTNYKFYTKAKTITPEQKTSYVYIYVFKPLGEDKPILTKIEPVELKQ